MEFFDYFEDIYDYPNISTFAGVPEGTLFNYISSTFLDGFINYVRPVKSYLVNRYKQEDGDWEYQKINASIAMNKYHTSLSDFNDDVIILAESDQDYWFFWYDRDVSDCSIGRFSKEDQDTEEVVQRFLLMLENHDCFSGILEIKYSGWVSF